MKETWQRGGRFVFLTEALPKAAEQFAGAVFVSETDLLNKICSTTAHDLVFIFESQFASLQKIDSCLQGQRIFVGHGDKTWLQSGWVDVIIPALDSEQWKSAFAQVQRGTKSLPDFRTTVGQPCLFLDRDDVVVKNVPYNKDPAQVVLTSGIAEFIHRAHTKNWWVALVTNQSGLGRDRITWEEYQKVHQQMLKLLAAQGAWIDESVWASHIEDAPHAAGDFFAGLRKPRPGMLQQVDDKLKVDLKSSVMVGDSASDVFAAYHAGLSNIYLLNTDKVDAEVVKIQNAEKYLPGLRYQVVHDFKEVPIG
jgi:D-glycero-D-manno-heptose 1,7-bisphosphate phosphatase